MAKVFKGEHEVHFTWLTNIDLPDDVSSVEILLAPARSVWDDHFTDTENTIAYELTLGNGEFGRCIPLKENIYHFLFRINNAKDLTASRKHDVTYLANGRMLNYVNVGDDVLINKRTLIEGWCNTLI